MLQKCRPSQPRCKHVAYKCCMIKLSRSSQVNHNFQSWEKWVELSWGNAHLTKWRFCESSQWKILQIGVGHNCNSVTSVHRGYYIRAHHSCNAPLTCKLRSYFFENVHLFGQDCKYTPHYCCNCTWGTQFCQFLQKHKENVVHSLNVFLHMNSCLQIAHLISGLQIMFTPCSHQLWFIIIFAQN